MLSGVRWQLAAFIVSILIFAIAVSIRLINQPEQPTPDQTTQQTAAMATSSTPEPASSPIPDSTATPAPAVNPPAEVPAANLVSNLPEDGLSTYREALVGSLQRINPLYVDLNSVDRDISALIFEGLIRINEYGEPVGDLARDWIVSRDGMEYVFTLRDDVLWHDGIRFTADDVVFTASILSSDSFSGPEDVRRFWQTVETQKLGDFLIRFRLTQPLSSFLNVLSIGILPEHALRGTSAADLANHRFNISPIGTGPYQFESFLTRDNQSLSALNLRVAPVYRQRPEGQSGFAIERLRFEFHQTFDEALQALRTGQVDGLAAPSMNERQQILSLPGQIAYTQVEPKLGVLIFNWDEGDDQRFFAQTRVRQALLTGLNHITPVENRLSNRAIVADSPLMLNSWATLNDLPWPVYNPGQATALLANANIQRPEPASPDTETTEETTAEADAGSEPSSRFRFTIMTMDDPALNALAQEFATQWNQLNLDVSVESFGTEEFTARLEEARFNAAIVELPLSADPDVYAYWHIGQYPDGRNYGAVADDRISELLERGRRDPYGINRTQIYQQFQRLFAERAIAIPLYYPLYTYSVNSRIEGVQLGFLSNPADRFRNLADWQVN